MILIRSIVFLCIDCRSVLSFVSFIPERKPVSRLRSDRPSYIPIQKDLLPIDLKELHHMFPDQVHDFVLALRFPVAQVDPDGDR